MTTPPSSPERKPKRGAPLGNHNARKHGLTPRPKPPEYGSEKMQTVDLSLEIAVLRRQILHLEEVSLSAASFAETVEIARVIAQTASALSRLIRAQVIVFTADTAASSTSGIDWDQEILDAIAEVGNELHGKDDTCSSTRIPDHIKSPAEIPPGTRPMTKVFTLIRDRPK